MAKKDHSLDSSIVQAAMGEFLAKGFQKASVRAIAAAAGVTFGAIYTRYSTKDELFCALAEPLIEKIRKAFQQIRGDYYSGPFTPQALGASMQRESEVILHLLFDDYDRAVLLLCRSGGSSLEHFFDSLVQMKTQETLAFFRQLQTREPEEQVVALIVRSQYQMYISLIDGGFDLAEARRIFEQVQIYHGAGWAAMLTAAGTIGTV